MVRSIANLFSRVADPLAGIHPDFRTFPVLFEGEEAWLKCAVVRSRAAVRLLQHSFARATGHCFFASTYIPDGVQAMSFEIERIQTLAAEGLVVPRILFAFEHGILLSSLGPTIAAAAANTQDAPARRHVLEIAARGLGQLHARGQYHGRPSLKDLTLFEGKLGLIDLEHAPLRVMTLPEAQARDVWLFMLSASRYARRDPLLLPGLLDAYKEAAPAESLLALREVADALGPADKSLHALFTLFGAHARVPRAAALIRFLDTALPPRPPRKERGATAPAMPKA